MTKLAISPADILQSMPFSSSDYVLGAELLLAPAFLYTYRANFEKKTNDIMESFEKKQSLSAKRNEAKKNLRESLTIEVRNNVNIFNYVYSSLESRITEMTIKNEQRIIFEQKLLGNIIEIEACANSMDSLKRDYADLKSSVEKAGAMGEVAQSRVDQRLIDEAAMIGYELTKSLREMERAKENAYNKQINSTEVFRSQTDIQLKVLESRMDSAAITLKESSAVKPDPKALVLQGLEASVRSASPRQDELMDRYVVSFQHFSGYLYPSTFQSFFNLLFSNAESRTMLMLSKRYQLSS